jgi:hypothetical protein
MAGIGGQIPGGGGNNFRPPTTQSGKATGKPTGPDELKAPKQDAVASNASDSPSVGEPKAQPTAATEKALKADQDGLAALGRSQVTSSAIGLAGVQAVNKMAKAIPPGGANDKWLDKMATTVAARNPEFGKMDDLDQALYLSDVRVALMEEFPHRVGL